MTARRRFGSGSVERLRSGRFRARFRFADGRRRDLGVYETLPEAEGVLNATLELAQDEPLASPGGTTMRGAGERFLDRRELAGCRNGPDDRKRWTQLLKTVPFADWPIANITTRDVRHWLEQETRRKSQVTGRRIATATAQNSLNLLRAFLNDAVVQGLAETNPAKDVSLPKTLRARSDEPWTFLNPTEQGALLAAVPESEWTAVAFAIGTGLRQAEQWNLRIDDVHVDVPRPEIVVRYSKGGKPTKTGRIRRVPLFGLGLQATHRQLKRLRGKRNPKRLLFPNSQEGVRKGPPSRWHEWVEKAGIGRRVRWHDLRHTCASSLISGDWGRAWSLEEVMTMLGHSDVKMTQRYAHLGETALKRAAVETEVAFIGPRLAQKSAQVQLQPAEMAAFLNRWSRVRISPGALFDSTHLDEAPSEGVGQSWAKVAELAELYLRACASGAPCDDLATALAESVLEDAAVKLALDVLEGDEHRHVRATELASAVLRALAARTTTKLKGGDGG